MFSVWFSLRLLVWKKSLQPRIQSEGDLHWQLGADRYYINRACTHGLVLEVWRLLVHRSEQNECPNLVRFPRPNERLNHGEIPE